MTFTIDSYLQETAAATAQWIRSMTDEQLRFRPTTTSWNAIEVLEHMMLAEEMTLGPIRQQLDAAPVTPADQDRFLVDNLILKVFASREVPATAPPLLLPSGKLTLAEITERRSHNHRGLTGMLEAGDALRLKQIPSLPIQAVSGGRYTAMDGHQWVLLTLAHNARHNAQIAALVR